MLTVPEIIYAMYRFPKQRLYVCTTCFQLTALVQDWARCACEPAIELSDPMTFDPTVALLCVLCARGAVRKGEPYWWQGCSCCLKFNGQLRARIGEYLQMSQMSSTNYALVEHFAKDELTRRRMNAHIDQWTKEWNVIFQWGKTLAKELWFSVPEWADDRYIGIKAWEAKFPRSPEISEKMFLQFTGWKDMATLDKAFIEQKSRHEAVKAKQIRDGLPGRR